MGQINFITGLIGKKLSLGAKFELNREDWNLKKIKFNFYQVN
jgi:hypothetical protein